MAHTSVVLMTTANIKTRATKLLSVRSYVSIHAANKSKYLGNRLSYILFPYKIDIEQMGALKSRPN